MPGDEKELEIEYALAREIIRRAVLSHDKVWEAPIKSVSFRTEIE